MSLQNEIIEAVPDITHRRFYEWNSVPTPEEPIMDAIPNTKQGHTPWNKGKLTGQKRPLKLKEIWAIRIHLQLARHA